MQRLRQSEKAARRSGDDEDVPRTAAKLSAHLARCGHALNVYSEGVLRLVFGRRERAQQISGAGMRPQILLVELLDLHLIQFKLNLPGLLAAGEG